VYYDDVSVEARSAAPAPSVQLQVDYASPAERAKAACGKIDLRQIKGLMIGGTVGGGVSAIAGGLNFAGQIKNASDLKKAEKEYAAGNESRLTDKAVEDLVNAGKYTEEEIRGADARINAAVESAKADYKGLTSALAEEVVNKLGATPVITVFKNKTFRDALNPQRLTYEEQKAIALAMSGQPSADPFGDAFRESIRQLNVYINGGMDGDVHSDGVMDKYEDETEATRNMIGKCFDDMEKGIQNVYNTNVANTDRGSSNSVSDLLNAPSEIIKGCVRNYNDAVEREPFEYIASLQETTGRERQILQEVNDAKAPYVGDLNINQTLPYQKPAGVGKLGAGTGGIVTSGLAAAGGLTSAITGGIGIAQFSQLEKEIKDCQDAVKDL